ncbi:unnamed protein product [Camellia sinensis]
MYLLHALIPFLKHFNQEQLMEKEIEVKIQGLSLAALELQKAACEKDERVYWRSVMVTCRECSFHNQLHGIPLSTQL